MGLGADMKEWIRTTDILQRLEKASDDRVYRVKDALRLGVPLKTIQNLTKIDAWFLQQIKDLVTLEDTLLRHNVPEDLTPEFMLRIKQAGLSGRPVMQESVHGFA